VVGTATADLRGIWRMARKFATGDASLDLTMRDGGVDDDLSGQLARFAPIGVVSTIVFAVLFVVLSGPLGLYGADIVALMLCSIANTAANRRLTFSLRGGSERARHYLAGIVLAALPLTLTLITLAALATMGSTSLATALVALVAINGVATVMRFVLLRSWVFRPR
jgi:putative flippase GtrA